MKLVLADRHKLVLRSDSNRGLGCLAAAVADRVVKNRDRFEGSFGRELRIGDAAPKN